MRRTSLDVNDRTVWIEQTELLKLQQSGQFPDEPAKIETVQIHSVDTQTSIRVIPFTISESDNR